MSALAPTLQAFFTDRLIRQRRASPHTITAYRNTLRMLIVFTAQRTGKPAHRLDVYDLDAPLIAAFLDHLEHDRANNVRTRNARLAAIHSLFRFAALRHPEHAADIERVLAIPAKRADHALVTYLTELELDTLLASPDRSTWTGRRDHPDHARRADRAACLRDNLADLRRPAPRRRRPCQLPRQGS
jgi:integrase/recombinase XerD